MFPIAAPRLNYRTFLLNQIDSHSGDNLLQITSSANTRIFTSTLTCWANLGTKSTFEVKTHRTITGVMLNEKLAIWKAQQMWVKSK